MKKNKTKKSHATVPLSYSQMGPNSTGLKLNELFKFTMRKKDVQMSQDSGSIYSSFGLTVFKKKEGFRELCTD